jgi:uncharacterized protein
LNQIVWLEWGQEAFDKARSSGKPILLDITGSWCHWCHVMDETSYSDPVIISTITKSFIPIRVDTDRRPDVNRRYNLGGWPTTAFLDSDGRIITGGTYIPPQQLREVLRSVLDFYSTNKGKVRSKLEPRRLPSPRDESVSEKITRDIATTIAVNFDIDYGGFGFEPKFPHPEALDYALLRYRYHGEKEMLTVATKTLDRMASGGMYDHVEQGFFRYSTTRDWSIPHFEKMAEDNAKLLVVYLHAFQLTGKTFYKDIAEGIVKYVQANLTDVEHGGFFGSQDADEDYYKLDLPARKNRKAPTVDRTLYINYNALLISSFLLASTVLGNEETGKYALKTLDRIVSLGKEGSLPFHYVRDGEGPMLKGFLIDYATLINSLIDSYEFTGKLSYLETALKIANECIENLNDKNQQGFYDIPLSDSNLGELKTRDKPIDENSLIAMALLRLSWITGQDHYSAIAGKTLDLFNQDYERYGLAASSYALAVDSYLNGPIGITIVAAPKPKAFAQLKSKALKIYPARRYVSYLSPTRDSERIATLGYDSTTPAAYVCVGKTCGPPIHDPSQLEPSVTSLLEAKPLASSEIPDSSQASDMT